VKVLAVVIRIVLRAKALVRGERFDERAVNAKMLIRHQPLLLRARYNLSEERFGDIAVDQAVSILGKTRWVPDRIVGTKTDEPSEQEVIVELLDQKPLAADTVRRLQEQGSEQPFWGNRTPAIGRINPVQVARNAAKRAVDQQKQSPQRMIRWNHLLVVEMIQHPTLLEVA
jgi:hypothetical protein